MFSKNKQTNKKNNKKTSIVIIMKYLSELKLMLVNSTAG